MGVTIISDSRLLRSSSTEAQKYANRLSLKYIIWHRVTNYACFTTRAETSDFESHVPTRLVQPQKVFTEHWGEVALYWACSYIEHVPILSMFRNWACSEIEHVFLYALLRKTNSGLYADFTYAAAYAPNQPTNHASTNCPVSITHGELSLSINQPTAQCL